MFRAPTPIEHSRRPAGSGRAVRPSTDRESGFTLIEIMVVVLIIAILLAIAIPTFLGSRDAANARVAQSDLRNALTAEQTEFTAVQSFSATPATMKAVEASLDWINGAAALNPPHEISVAIGATGKNVVLLEAQGQDSNCYYIEQSDDATHSYTGYAETSGQCASLASVTPTIFTTLPTSGQASANIGSSSSTPWTTGFYGSF